METHGFVVVAGAGAAVVVAGLVVGQAVGVVKEPAELVGTKPRQLEYSERQAA